MAPTLVLIRSAPEEEHATERPRPVAGPVTVADRAVIELLVVRQRTYGEIASLLRLDVNRVRARAHAAADRLAGSASWPLGSDARGQIADLVFGQQTAAQRHRTRRLISQHPSAAEWHAVLSERLAIEGLAPSLASRSRSDLEVRADAFAGEAEEHARRALELEQARVALTERIERLEAARAEQDERTTARIQELEAAQRRIQGELDTANDERRRLKTALVAAREESASTRVQLRERDAELTQLRAYLREREHDAPLLPAPTPVLAATPVPAATPIPAPTPLPALARVHRHPTRRRRVGSLVYVTGATGAVAVGIALIANGADSTPSVAAQVPPENAPVANPGEHAAGLAHARVVSEFTMTPVGPLATVTGSGALLRAGSQRTLVVRLKAPRRRAGSSYAVWLTGHGRPKLLGFVPPARAAGTFAGDTALPAHTARFKTVLITVERNQSPTRPGARVLRAALSLPLSRP